MEYTIGGYQVIKKWLTYREQPLLLLLQPALDANYESIKTAHLPKPSK